MAHAADAVDQPLATGQVLQVNVSPGGLPKLPVESAWVGRFGVAGDRQREVTRHGGPHRAVCLLAIETIERLQAEGHPIKPGSTGENLTTTGVEWSVLPVGTRARIGGQLEIELASPANPCENLKPSFSDGRFSRLSIDLHPTDSRMYGRVLQEGSVHAGDEIVVLPAAPGSRAKEELLLKRLDRAEAKSSVAAWRAAADAGFDVTVVEDADLMMAASPDIPGPAYNHAAGLARMPHLIPMATDFYDRNGCPGWLITEEAPWPDTQPSLVLGMYGAEPGSIAEVPAPAGVHIRVIESHEAAYVDRVFAAAGLAAGGISDPRAPNPWPAVNAAVAASAHRFLLLAELDGAPVGTASLHIHRHSGWLRGAAVVPEARGRGIQRALIGARARLAAELGCDLVGASAKPSGPSAANLQQMGMRRIGTRTHYVYVPAGVPPPPAPK
jgi:MOSC domain-containing protein YiiM/GNAT superfamily N-acetyltransferase